MWLSLQFQGSTLQEEVANGRPWDLDRNLGGLRILLPHEGTGGMDEEGFARGTPTSCSGSATSSTASTPTSCS